MTRFLVTQGIRTGKASVTVDVAGVGANEMQIEAFRQEIRRVSPFQAITYKGAISPTPEGKKEFSLQYKKEVR